MRTSFKFWETIQAILKLVEFRSPQQKITFVTGMCLLFSLKVAEGRKGQTELLAAGVLEIIGLSH